MVIHIISMCFCIFLSSFRRVCFKSDDFAQSYRLSKRVPKINPGHVKGVHDVNRRFVFVDEFYFERSSFPLKVFSQKSMDCL